MCGELRTDFHARQKNTYKNACVNCGVEKPQKDRYYNKKMPGSKGQKAVHACMIRLLNLGPAKHEEGVICVANQRIPNVCRIAGAACCGAIREHQLGAKDLLTPTS